MIQYRDDDVEIIRPECGGSVPEQIKKKELIMGELKRQTLGEASGAVGHLVFRIKGKRNIIAHRPIKKVQPSVLDPEVQARRDKFKLTGKVAAGINETGVLKYVWPQPGENQGSRFNEIFKKNYETIGTIGSIGEAQVVPSFGIGVVNAAITLTATGVTITADSLAADSEIDPNVEKFLVAEGIIILTTPLKSTDPSCVVLSVKTGLQGMDSDQPINMAIVLSATDKAKYTSYTNKKVFLSFLTLTTAGAPIHFTEQIQH